MANNSGSQRNHPELVKQCPVVVQQEQPQSQQPARSCFTPPHAGLAEACMDDLFMSALHCAAADPISQTQVLVVSHPRGIVTVIANEGIEAFPHLRRGGAHAFEPSDHILDLATAEVFSQSVDPLIRLHRSFTVSEPRKTPRVFHSMPKIQYFAPAAKHTCSVPYPLSSVPHNDHNSIDTRPTQFLQLCPEATKYLVGVSKAAY